MKTRISTLLLILPVAVAAVVGTRGEKEPLMLPTAVAAPPAQAREAERVRQHLLEVERELLTRDVSHLSAELRAARVAHLAALRAYREAGRFPHNHDHPEQRLPYFVDAHGTPCAMAYLIARSGGAELVRRIAAERNNARVVDLADEAELLAWLDASGLTLDEAARIQPWYDHLPPEPERRESASPGYLVATALAGAVNGGAIALNLTAHESERSRARGVFGVVAGVAGLGLGLAKLQDGGSATTFGAVNAGIGLTSAALGVGTLISGPADRAPPSARAPTPAVRAELAPSIDLAAASPAAGVQLRLGF